MTTKEMASIAARPAKIQNIALFVSKILAVAVSISYYFYSSFFGFMQ